MDLFLKISVLSGQFLLAGRFRRNYMFRDGKFCLEKDNCWRLRGIDV